MGYLEAPIIYIWILAFYPDKNLVYNILLMCPSCVWNTNYVPKQLKIGDHFTSLNIGVSCFKQSQNWVPFGRGPDQYAAVLCETIDKKWIIQNNSNHCENLLMLITYWMKPPWRCNDRSQDFPVSPAFSQNGLFIRFTTEGRSPSRSMDVYLL